MRACAKLRDLGLAAEEELGLVFGEGRETGVGALFVVGKRASLDGEVGNVSDGVPPA